MTALCWVLLSLNVASDEEIVIPTVGRPSADFYNAASGRLKITASADRMELGPEDWLVYALRIEGLKNGKEVVRPKLQNLPAFSATFQIEDLPEGESVPAGQRLFRYRLRPRNAEASLIPGFAFRYYDPRDDNPATAFRLAVTPTIPLIVKASKASAKKIGAKEFFDSWPGLRSERQWKGIGLWFLAMVCICCAIWLPFARWFARYKLPSRMESAARKALRKTEGLPPIERALLARDVLRNYLKRRIGLDSKELSASELVVVIGSSPYANASHTIECFEKECQSVLYGNEGADRDWVRLFQSIADRIEGRIL